MSESGPHEATFLKLDCSKMKNTFDWKPKWNLETAMEKIVEWYDLYVQGCDIRECMEKQIKEYGCLE